MNIGMSNNEYRMSNNEFKIQQWIQDPTMNSLMNIQFFEIQFFGLLDPGPPILGVRI